MALFDIDIAGVVTLVVAFFGYGKASRNAHRVVAAHLDAVAAWCNDGRGWTDADITLGRQIEWLNPTQTVFPLASGPALIQMTLGDKLTLGGDLVSSIVALNQTIDSFNAVIGKAESLRTAHAVALARAHVDAVRRIAAAGAAGLPIDLNAALAGQPQDVRDAAHLVIAVLTMLHTGLIGTPGGQGMCRAYRAARAAFNEGRP